MSDETDYDSVHSESRGRGKMTWLARWRAKASILGTLCHARSSRAPSGIIKTRT